MSEFAVGTVVRLTEYGHKILGGEYTDRQDIPRTGSTAVITSVLTDFGNPSFIVEFFAMPGRDWEVYAGEIELVA